MIRIQASFFFLILLTVSCTFQKEDNKSISFDSDQYKKLSGTQKSHYLDSLAVDYNTDKNDSITRNFLFTLASEYYYLNQLKKSLHYSDKVLKLAKADKDTISIARAYFYKADCFEYNQKDSAYYYYHQAEKFYKAKNDQAHVGQTLFKKAYILFFEGNYLESEIQVSKALQLLEKKSDSQLLYSCYVLMGYNFQKLEEYDNALKYFKLSKKELDKLRQSDIDFEKTNNYSVNYAMNMANVYDGMGEYTLSINELTPFKTAALKAQWPRDYASLIGNLGYSKMKSGDLEAVESLFTESLAISKRHNHLNNLLYQLRNLGEYYALVKDTSRSVAYLKEAYTVARKLKAGEEIKSTLKLLSDIDLHNHLKYSKAYITISDSLSKAQRNSRNKFARIEYETAAIEDENKTLNMEKFYIGIVSLLAILLLLTFIVYRYFKNKQRELDYQRQKQLAEEEIYDLLRNNQIQLREAKELERNRIARELHDGIMNKIYSTRLQLGILNQSDAPEAKEKRMTQIQVLQEIERDIRAVSHDLHSDEFEEHFDYYGLLNQLILQQNETGSTLFVLKADTTIPWNSISGLIKINLYRIIQEALLNVSKHAEAQQCIVSLSVEETPKVLTLIIEDDGKGFEVSGKKSKGIGLKNIGERAKLLKAEFMITGKAENGTVLKLRLPI